MFKSCLIFLLINCSLMAMNIENEQLIYSFYQLPHGIKKEISESSTLKKLNIDFKDFIHPDIYYILQRMKIYGDILKLSDISYKINKEDEYFELAKEFNKIYEKEYIYFVQNKKLIIHKDEQNKNLFKKYFLNGPNRFEIYKNMLKRSLSPDLYAHKINGIGLSKFFWQTIMASVITIESIRATIITTTQDINTIKSQDKFDEAIDRHDPLSRTKAKLNGLTLLSGKTNLKTDEIIKHDSENYERQIKDLEKLDHDMKALMSIALGENFINYSVALNKLYNDIESIIKTTDQNTLNQATDDYLRKIYLLNRLAEKYIHDNIPWSTYSEILTKNQKFMINISEIIKNDLQDPDLIFYIIIINKFLKEFSNKAGPGVNLDKIYNKKIKDFKNPNKRKIYINKVRWRYISRNNDQNNN